MTFHLRKVDLERKNGGCVSITSNASCAITLSTNLLAEKHDAVRIKKDQMQEKFLNHQDV